jgi:aryl-alcohol dehydrogenase-like predicted oxidoreductase
MQPRQLGNSDLQLTRIGLGTWAMGGGDWKFGWGPQDDHESIRTIHRALDLGINWIDTAPAYGLGHCEEVVGRALAGIGRRPIVATKCGRVWDEQRQLSPRLKAQSIRAEVEASLKRLRTEVIDLYQVHWAQPDEDIEEAWTAIADIVRQGKVRWAGVCNFSVTQLDRVRAIAPVVSLQPPYSLLNRGVEAELLPYCAAHNLGVVAYSPMQKGLLTGKVTREWIEQLPAADHRHNDPQFQEPRLTANLELAAGLQRVAEKNRRSVSQLAIAWDLRRPEVTAAIVGARRPSQIEETIGAADWQLAADDLAEIDRLLAKQQATA